MNPEEERIFMKQLHEKHPGAFRELFLNFYNALVYFAMGYVKDDLNQKNYLDNKPIRKK